MSENSAEKKRPNCKICCACPAERRARDECTMLKGVDACKNEVETFYKCLLTEGFSQDECVRRMNTEPPSELLDQRPVTAPSRGVRRHHVLFPLYRDRLACDPQNCLCVYDSHEFKWGDNAEDSEQSIRALVDSMVRAARGAFGEALAYWAQLPASVQRAIALRSMLSGHSTALHAALAHPQPNLQHSSSFVGGSDATVSLRRSAVNRSSAFGVDSLLLHEGASRLKQSTAMTASQSRTAPRSSSRERFEEDAVDQTVVGLWDPPQNGPRCRIVVDIVASRKTLGDEPQKSEPYRLGQHLYRYVQEQYAAEGMSVFVGISDSSMTLVGRDILFPYRTTGSGASLTSAVRVGKLRNPGTGAAVATAEAMLASMVTGGTYSSTNLENALASVIPSPSAIAVQATKTEKVDNIRLVVCYPSVGEVAV